jgi:FtsP/CotA-like multicopper oxidase with cupredoxin domain
VSRDPLGRREFLAGGGGLLLCTLAGQQVRLDRQADVESLGSHVPVPPRVAAAEHYPQGTTVLAAAGPTKEYWIRAEPVSWNIVPSGRDQMMNEKVTGKTKFQAYAYRAYSPGFEQPLGPATIPGPTIDATVGETVVVNFENGLGTPVTMHPHGIFYSEEMDGSYKGRFTDPGGFVQPGRSFRYVWDAVEGTEGNWHYHDHGPTDPLPVYKGLFGSLIIRPQGAPKPDREFFLAFHSFQPVATGIDRAFWCLNGRAYAGNTPTFRAKVGQRVAFRVFALDDDFHTFHLHGHRWKDESGKVVDTVSLGPADSISVEFVEDNPGRWFYHCHVFSHLHAGMNGWYIVE